MIEQIIMNLAINARDAMANGGQLSVSLDSLTIDPARAAGHPHVSSGPFVCIAVGDTGCGISSENISRIFEPFFTTKDIGKGTGLGLAIVFGIVEQHHGWIEVESELDHGATFRIFLPALEREISSRAIAPAKPKPVGGQETVLLVEDETALRTVAAAVLEQYGYKVLAAPLPSAALEIWEQRRGTIDLVLVDLMMPGGISGRELAERLLADEPTLKVIYSSGYSEDIVRRQLHLDPGRNFLQKPCTSMALLHAVRRCLDEDRVRGD
jgi:CheY-like chemotaxis protein